MVVATPVCLVVVGCDRTLQCPTYSCRNPVIPVESTGIPQEFHWNKNGIKQTKVEILIYLSQFLKLCRSIQFYLLSLLFLHNVYSSTLPLKFNSK